MIAEKNKISVAQLGFFTVQTAIGEGALTLPYNLHSKASIDGWISMLLAGLITQIAVVLVWMVCRKYPGQMLVEILPRLVGKLAGNLISALYIGYFMGIASIVLMNYTRIINAWIFPTTPKWVIVALMAVTSYYLAKERLRVIARFDVMISVLLLVLIVLLFFPISEGNMLYILPVGQSGMENIWRGIKEAVITLAGFELLFVAYPHIKGNSKDILKCMILSYSFVILFYLLVTLSCFIFYSPEELKLIPEPVLYMLKTFSFRIVERTDLLFLSIWVVIVMTSIVSYMFLASVSLSKLLKVSNTSKVTLVVVVVCSVLAWYSHNYLLIQDVNNFFADVTIVFIYILPLLMLTVSGIRGRRKVGG